MEIRRFKEEDAKAVSEVIRTTIRISNTKDYPVELMDELIASETPDAVLGRASWTHFYVALDEGKIKFGVYACSPEDSSFTAVFSNIELTECAWKAHE